MEQKFYGRLPGGEAVREYTLCNSRGMRVSVIDYGAIITGIYYPVADNRAVNMVLAYDNLAGYLNGSSYVGAVVGRVANRIAGGVFSIDGRRYQLAVNNGPNHLHGGLQGYDKKLWRAEAVNAQELRLTLVSEHGDQGYPGDLSLQVIYRLTDDNELRIDYRALCETAATPVNLTQHSYFNLTGTVDRTIGAHELTLFADQYTPVDATGIPEGHLASLTGSALDFRQPRRLDEVLQSGAAEVVTAGGVDHNFVVRRDKTGALVRVALLHEPVSGRSMEVWSTQPGVQVYTGNYLHEDAAAALHPFVRYGGVCLECQGFPDAVNQPDFPPVVIRPGESYRETTCYRFYG